MTAKERSKSPNNYGKSKHPKAGENRGEGPEICAFTAKLVNPLALVYAFVS
jgi:hypothetical protein